VFRFSRIRKFTPWLPTVASGVFAVVLVASVWHQRLDHLRAELHTELSSLAGDWSSTAQYRLMDLRQSLVGVRALVGALGSVSDAEWQRFVRELDLSHHRPEVLDVGFALRVAASQVEEHTRRVRASGWSQYAVQPLPSEHEFAIPVVRYTPLVQQPIVNSDGPLGHNLATTDKWADQLRLVLLAKQTRLLPCDGLPLPHSPSADGCLVLIEPLEIPGAYRNPTTGVMEDIQGWMFMRISLDQMQAALAARVAKPYAASMTIQKPVIATTASDMAETLQQELKLYDLPVWLEVRFTEPLVGMRTVGTGEIVSAFLVGCLVILATVFSTKTRLQSRRLARLARKIKASEENYRYLATHDPLTHAANRTQLLLRLEALNREAIRYQHRFGLIYFDLDKFKQVNDNLGHQAGDQLLLAVVDRVRTVLRDSDLLARNGGDEFVVLLPQVPSEDTVVQVATKIRDALVKPFEIGGHLIQIGSSLGVVISTISGVENIDVLIQLADQRMYDAKRAGGNRVVGSGELPNALPCISNTVPVASL
jgi:diguanylate cyclase (GGDEF)-like protein